MSWHVRFEEKVRRRHPRAGQWYAQINQQPGWVTKTALTLALLVVVVPIVILTLAAVCVGILALLILGTIARIARFFSNPFNAGTKPRNDGRQNVRVIERP